MITFITKILNENSISEMEDLTAIIPQIQNDRELERVLQLLFYVTKADNIFLYSNKRELILNVSKAKNKFIFSHDELAFLAKDIDDKNVLEIETLLKNKSFKQHKLLFEKHKINFLVGMALLSNKREFFGILLLPVKELKN